MEGAIGAMCGVNDPLVSCLCVTENRPAFMPWLLWCFDRQTWANRELVIIDSSAQPFTVPSRDDIRVIPAPCGTSVGRKRNLALAQARGEIITWFDDDDWQHPDKLARLVRALNKGAACAGSCRAWFVDLMNNRCMPHRNGMHLIVFNSAGFRKDAAMAVLFSENVRKASDTQWLHTLAARYRTHPVIIDDDSLFFWLCHNSNLSNPARRRQFSKPLKALKDLIGPEAWGDTDEAMATLRARLGNQHPKPKASPRSQNTSVALQIGKVDSDSAKDAGGHNKSKHAKNETPAVCLMIKATVMDAPYLDVMVRHMIAQARYSFAERMIVVERQPSFSGKYHSRNRVKNDELDSILKELLAHGTVDRVLDVDMKPKRVREIVGRYFATEAGRVPTHASTGGPIYATLFGMESLCTDYVLQMDSDVFFNASEVSWVEQALKCMYRDPDLWLMMTHPGPPAGPPGRSLGPRNARIAKWDPDLQIYRFSTATTRYFLCDRRRLHGRFRPVQQGSGYAPLEQCITNALRRHGAFRGALGNLESWHLHAWHHGDPFPQWAAALAKTIEAGDYPTFQRGEYDLRLDRKGDRREWSKLLQCVPSGSTGEAEFSSSRPCYDATEKGDKRKESRPTVMCGSGMTSQDGTPLVDQTGAARGRATVADADAAKAAPLAVVIPVRNRAGRRLRNAISSLHWQTAGSPIQVFVVSHGSQPEINDELSRVCAEEMATLLTIGAPDQPWNKPVALNVGIRSTSTDVPVVMTMDADMILAQDFISVVIERLNREPHALILCRSADLPQSVPLPSDGDDLLHAFHGLRAKTRLRHRGGTGGIQAAGRSFFFDIRGYDEDLAWWGALDGDVVNRARLAGLKVEWIEDRTAMLHQWHPRKHAALKDPKAVAEAKRAWIGNHALVRSRSNRLTRNPYGWGGMAGQSGPANSQVAQN